VRRPPPPTAGHRRPRPAGRVVPLDRLRPEALALAGQIAARGPLAVQAARLAVLRGTGRPLAEGLNIEAGFFRAVLRTDDAVEGATAFTEKRPPV
jgi:enoyl-CoA hydratase/carnithine racemase